MLRASTKIYNKNTITVNISDIQQSISHNDIAGTAKLGVIAIPDLNIYLPIYDKPYDAYSLEKGANQLKATDSNGNIINTPIGQGNLLLVAHNYSDGATMFSPLQQNKGQVEPYIINGSPRYNYWLLNKSIYIATKDHIYEYTINYQKLVTENDTSIQKDTLDPIINIITCLEPEDSFRIVTVGDLKKSYIWKDVPSKIAKYFDTNNYPFNLR